MVTIPFMLVNSREGKCMPMSPGAKISSDKIDGRTSD